MCVVHGSELMCLSQVCLYRSSTLVCHFKRLRLSAILNFLHEYDHCLFVVPQLSAVITCHFSPCDHLANNLAAMINNVARGHQSSTSMIED